MSKEDFSNLDEYSTQLGWYNLWKKPVKKILGGTSRQAWHVSVLGVFSFWVEGMCI